MSTEELLELLFSLDPGGVVEVRGDHLVIDVSLSKTRLDAALSQR